MTFLKLFKFAILLCKSFYWLCESASGKRFINKGNDDFSSIRKSGFVDKSGMIAVINKTLGTERRYSCVTRSRRFGKTIAAKMLCAYYDKSCDSRKLFEGKPLFTISYK